jgi:hypothetical protein
VAVQPDGALGFLPSCLPPPWSGGLRCFDLSTTFPWEALCAEVATLKVQRHERGQLARLSLVLPSILDEGEEALRQRQRVVLTGEPGVGKTCVLRALRHRLPQGGFRLTYCHNATLGRRDFYRQLCLALGLKPSAASTPGCTPACASRRPLPRTPPSTCACAWLIHAGGVGACRASL